ncbi:hypothetical protein BJ138DRAFT_1138714 [Hygrophoropsis aurantiaca]|uniref:Uncharacterized protein n=1 Tax=Hygrophoropsis aurantiaca TaxID=72124 RepID=A0ACB7ZRK1_9AGAM|nr:hypothetical protein BJ138DRAFT_1138714 [Hygrophoropsis aurantiaca]
MYCSRVVCSQHYGAYFSLHPYNILTLFQPFTASFPRADIHELLAPDLLHQIIKGTFKDHIVTWVNDYLNIVHEPQKAAAIIADIDRFKQWTGNDSKALMKVYLPAITGHVPDQMVRAMSAFLDFCYLVRHDVIDEKTILAIEDALQHYHTERTIFHDNGVTEGFLLPHQYAMKHYRHLTQLFGAPNGLCSSITESKHIKAVKKPYRRTSKVDMVANGMLDGALVPQYLLNIMEAPPIPEDDNGNDDSDQDSDSSGDDGDDDTIDGPRFAAKVTLGQRKARQWSNQIDEIGARVNQENLGELVRRFLFDQRNPNWPIPASEIDLDLCPTFRSSVSVFTSATASCYAPSDYCGIAGMHRQTIRAVESWRGGPARYDCVFAEKDPTRPVQVVLFFSFEHRGEKWFEAIGEEPCPLTGMWRVKPEVDEDKKRCVSVISVDSIMQSAHLIGIYGDKFIPQDLTASDSLLAFKGYYVNKFSDHHAYEIAF